MIPQVFLGLGVAALAYGLASRKNGGSAPAVNPPAPVHPVVPAPVVQPPEDPNASVNPPERPAPAFLEPEVWVQPEGPMPNEAPLPSEPGGATVEEDPEDPGLLGKIQDLFGDTDWTL